MPKAPESLTRAYIESLFDEDEIAMIWMALITYNIGPEDAEPELYEVLETRRERLVEVFE